MPFFPRRCQPCLGHCAPRTQTSRPRASRSDLILVAPSGWTPSKCQHVQDMNQLRHSASAESLAGQRRLWAAVPPSSTATRALCTLKPRLVSGCPTHGPAAELLLWAMPDLQVGTWPGAAPRAQACSSSPARAFLSGERVLAALFKGTLVPFILPRGWAGRDPCPALTPREQPKPLCSSAVGVIEWEK